MWWYIVCIVQIIGESLPISSSGQVELLVQFLHEKYLLTESMLHLLHAPTICIVVYFFYSRWVTFVRAPRRCAQLLLSVAGYVILADSCTVAFYIVRKIIGTQWFAIELGFIITGFILWSTRWLTNKVTKIGWCVPSALLLGSVQGIALLPGISRLGATYVTACWLGWSHKHALEVSFAIEVPLLLVAVCKATLLYPAQVYQLFLFPTNIIIVVSAFFAWCLLHLVDWMGYTKRLWFFSFYLYSIGIVTLVIKCFFY